MKGSWYGENRIGKFLCGAFLLNPRFGVSAKIKNSGFYGPLRLEGNLTGQSLNGRYTASCQDKRGYHPYQRVRVFFGKLHDRCDLKIQIERGNYYEITVELATDFQRLNQVQVIRNEFRTETITLEQSTINE
jgi:rod shape-determining protein MreC